MSAQSGWYPDPGGVPNLYRYWDGQAWSAATTPNPQSPPPPQGLVQGLTQPTGGQQTSGQQQNPYGQYGQSPYGQYGQGQPGAATFQAGQSRKSPVGWWAAAAALLVVIVVIAVIAVRAISGSTGLTGGPGGTQPTQDICPTSSASPSAGQQDPNDGRVHGGPVSYPKLGAPWTQPTSDDRVPFGTDVQVQSVDDQQNYDGAGRDWVASVLVAELMAGDGFYTPEQGAQIVVRCILGRFYGDNPVTSDVKVNKAVKIDGQDGWQVESQLSFDIPGLLAKGELLIVTVVTAGESGTAGLYYASIPDTRPELVRPAREALAKLKVDA